MIILPMCVALVVICVLFMQHNHYRFIERQKNFKSPQEFMEYIDILNKNLNSLKTEIADLKDREKESNERLNALMLRAGFVK